MIESILTYKGQQMEVKEIKRLAGVMLAGDLKARYKIPGMFGGAVTQNFIRFLPGNICVRNK